MKVKFKVAQGMAVISYKGDDVTLDEATNLLRSDYVISITVTKQTAAQYLKTVPALNEAAQSERGGEP